MLLQSKVKDVLFKNYIKFHSVLSTSINELQALIKNNHSSTEKYDMAPHDRIDVVRKQCGTHCPNRTTSEYGYEQRKNGQTCLMSGLQLEHWLFV